MRNVEPTAPPGATARGKLLLFGEHSVVHGHRAIGISLPLELTVRLRANANGGHLLTPGLTAQERALIDRALWRARTLTGLQLTEHTELTITSTVPEGRGLGSSGALCGALSRALFAAAAPAEYNDNSRRIWEVAHEMEHAFHGTPSGIDTGLALHNGLFAFTPVSGALPDMRSLVGNPLHLLATVVPRSGTTGALVADIGRRMSEGDAGTRGAIAELGAVAEEAELMLGSPHTRPGEREWIGGLASLVTRAHELLRSLGLSSLIVETILSQANQFGALGGKLSGAGGGGALYLLYRNRTELCLGAPLLRSALSSIADLGECPVYPLEWSGTAIQLIDA